jgi:hypothetical protein
VDEYEWLTCSDTQLMLRFLRDADLLSDRKAHLFAIACYRRVWNELEDEQLQKSVEFVESSVDGQSGEKEPRGNDWGQFSRTSLRLWNATGISFVSAEFCVQVAARSLTTEGQGLDRAWEETFRQSWARGCVSTEARLLADAQAPADWLAERRRKMRQEERGQTGLLRDMFGSSFGAISIEPRWLTSDVIDLARVCYDERAFERLPILADALMDAGCDNDEIINHCREQGRGHVKGCWVIDLLLGKS